MTEKRFIGSSGGFYDQYKNDRFSWSEWEEILQIMNNLNEKARERSKALSKLQKENEQLKERNQELYDKLQETMSRHSLNMGEIELIKHMIQKAYETERTQIGKNVLKQLMEAIE